MKTIETNATVTPDGKLVLQLQLPPEFPAGEHRVVVVIDEQPVKEDERKEERPPLNFPVRDYGPWPADLSLRREDMYGERGR